MKFKREQILEKVKKILAESLNIDQNKITETSKVLEEPFRVLCEESVAFLDISFRLDKEFGIKTVCSDFKNDMDVKSLIRLVQRKLPK